VASHANLQSELLERADLEEVNCAGGMLVGGTELGRVNRCVGMFVISRVGLLLLVLARAALAVLLARL
jgi:hypothetical protein